MTWDPSPELVERAVTGWYVEPADRARILRAAVDSGELIPRERVEELALAATQLRSFCVEEPYPLCSEDILVIEELDAALALYAQEPKG